MRIDHIAALIRLRSPWEAVDLGFALIQSWWKAIFVPWLCFAIPIAFLIYMSLPEDNKIWAIAIFWWLKPLYERFLLFILSHRLFREPVSTHRAFSQLPWMLSKTGLLSALTFRRFSLSRGFNLPIWQLEQQRGIARVKRQQVLHAEAHGHAVLLTISMLFIEFILILSAIGFMFLFLPETQNNQFTEALMLTEGDEINLNWVYTFFFILYVAVTIVVEPFYVAGNFSLYLNRRTRLEAWDIELRFRNLAKRLTTPSQTSLHILLPTTLLCMTLFGFASLSPSPVQADDHAQLPLASDSNIHNGRNREQSSLKFDIVAPARVAAEQSRQVIDEIMQLDNLSQKKKSWRWEKISPDKQKEKPDDSSLKAISELFEAFGKLIAYVVEAFLWLLLAFAAYLLYRYRDYWLPYLKRNQADAEQTYQAPEVLFGMDVRPESLPDDPHHVAQALWQEKNHREAMSLLYRTALIHLVTADEIEIKDSHTEGDILQLTTQKVDSGKHQFIKQLTQQWLTVAYAHRTPDEHIVDTLLADWLTYFPKEQS